MDKKITVAFGRFNPPTIGHKKLIDSVKDTAKKEGTDHLVIASHSHDAKKNPLSPEDKEHHLKKMFPKTNFRIGSKEHANIIDHLDRLHKEGHTHVNLVVGSDRVQAMHDIVHKYNGTHEGARYNFKHLQVTSAGHRDPDAEGAEGASGSKQREHAKSGNFDEFAKGVPSNKKHAKDLYHAVRKGMKLENIMPNFKALFLVGGPGSGKDFLIHSVLDECKLKEVSLDKLYTAIVEQHNIEELTDFPSVIVNGNADNKEKIVVSKAILEMMGYDTAIVYVHSTNEESKIRNDLRISLGAKTFSESVRQSKYDMSIQNMQEYSELFESFVIYDNSNNFSTVNEEKQREIAGWLVELADTITAFLSNFPTNEAALRWMHERVMEVGTNSAAKFHKEITPGQASNKAKTYAQADKATGCGGSCGGKCRCDDKYAGGVASANVNSPTRTTVEEAKKTSSAKKKSANIPSNYADVKSYAIGSMGIASEPVGGTANEEKKSDKKKMKKLPTSPGLSGMFPTALGTVPSAFGLSAYKESTTAKNLKNKLATKIKGH